jgi:hypothetical protein
VNAYVCNGADGKDGKDGTGATRADGPCFSPNRYADCGNGTVTDSVTGLIWLKKAGCLGFRDYFYANLDAADLKDGLCALTDKSSPGDWRLPTKDEWSATIARAVALGCTDASGPSLTNDAGFACLSVGPSSFEGVASGVYWSSTALETFPTNAWVAHLDFGTLNFAKFKDDNTVRVWPVRGPH